MKTQTDKTFADLEIQQHIIDALKKEDIINPTEIQAQALPHALKGRDVIGRSITGSGKTLAFSIPIIEVLAKNPGRGVRALVLAPTRELAKQVDEEFRMAASGSKLQTAIIYGGVGYEPQFEALKKADVVIGTPGRIMDHMERSTLSLAELEFFVLDEADRMLDMGFIDDIKKIIDQAPMHKQNFFFSATMPGEARELAESFMHDPELVSGQTMYVSNDKLEEYYVDSDKLYKADTLRELLAREKPGLAIVFVNTRRFADGLASYLQREGFKARALHGGFAQNKREQIVDEFDVGDTQIICATDVAARGLDIDGVTHVFNFEVPKNEQDYTHRIGRTARAGKSGKAITLLEPEEHRLFARIEGDSQREIMKYGLTYHAKKVYLLPKRSESSGRGRRGSHKKGGSRRR